MKTTLAKRASGKVWRTKHPNYQKVYRERSRPAGWVKGRRRSYRNRD